MKEWEEFGKELSISPKELNLALSDDYYKKYIKKKYIRIAKSIKRD